jgi:hypothetical protein
MYEKAVGSGGAGKPPSPSGPGPRSPLAMRPLPQSPPPAYLQHQEARESIYNIYSQPSYAGKPMPPAYSSAPPYRPKEPLPAPPKTSPQKQVHFAASPRTELRGSPSAGLRASPSAPPPVARRPSPPGPRVANSESGSSSLSGPSSLDSVLYDDSLASIERSNQELEQRLDLTRARGAPPAGPRLGVDTIHNNRHLEQEIIYEESLSDLSRSSSVSTLKPDWPTDRLDHPSLADLGSIADLSAKFQSLTAKKLMAGLSISSIDTLLEVNSDERNNGKLSILNESTETIDFGVI